MMKEYMNRPNHKASDWACPCLVGKLLYEVSVRVVKWTE